jgi:hypothetical protein
MICLMVVGKKSIGHSALSSGRNDDKINMLLEILTIGGLLWVKAYYGQPLLS